MNTLVSFGAATDITITATLVAVCVVYSLWKNTGPLLSIALSLPIAGFFFTLFPYREEMLILISHSAAPWLSLVLFLLFLVLALWILQRIVGTPIGKDNTFHIITTSIALTILLIAFWYHIDSLEKIYDFGSPFDSLFGSSTNFFWITILAILALFVV